MVNASDIALVLTGGSANTVPNLSLGGDPSGYPIGFTINNLFDNVTENQATAGSTEYRCMYIFNNNISDSFYNLKVYAVLITGSVSDIELGITQTSEIQNVTITGATGGSFDISYLPPTQGTVETRTVLYDADPATWASNLQGELNSIPTLADVIVSPAGNFTSRIFNVLFSGDNDYRNHDLLEVDDTDLTGGVISSSVSKSIGGAPINSIPVLLETESTTPSGVTFYSTSEEEPILIGSLYPEEGFPLWVKRIVTAGSEAVAGEGFTLKLIANPIQI